MRTFEKTCAQGDVLFIKVDSMPDGMVKHPLEGGKLIVTHSETGHHHVMDHNVATMYDNPENPLESFVVVSGDAILEHLRPHDTHESIQFSPGTYKAIRQREYTSEGFRRVID